jgi:DNA-binding NtrC family response regulator
MEPDLALLDAAPAAWNVLLSGPTGAGKSITARRLHDAWQRNLGRRGAFVHVNAASIPRELVASILFGHERGAFTGAGEKKPGAFQDAHGGTLFLDEVGDLPLEQQVHLLTALDLDDTMHRQVTRVGAQVVERVNVRLVLGTNRELYRLAREGLFRLDLLGRVSTHHVRLPPLALARHRVHGAYLDHLERLARWYPSPVRFTFDRDAQRRFHAYVFSEESRWPWNYRDVLQSAERLALRAWADGHGRRPAQTPATGTPFLTSNITLRHVERELAELRERHASLEVDAAAAPWDAAEARARPEAWAPLSHVERWELCYLLQALDATTNKADAWRWIAARNLLEGASDPASMNNPSNAFEKRWKRYAACLREAPPPARRRTRETI